MNKYYEFLKENLEGYEFDVKGYICKASVGRYCTGENIAIAILNLGSRGYEPYCKFTVNIPEIELEEYEIITDEFSLNEVACELLKSGFFERTEKGVKCEFKTYPIWEVKT